MFCDFGLQVMENGESEPSTSEDKTIKSLYKVCNRSYGIMLFPFSMLSYMEFFAIAFTCHLC